MISYKAHRLPPRVRFAPSPTGPLHVGGLRTALFNYLFAKKTGGDFILRIEDTDKKREVKGAEKYIIDSLNWCGISPDEKPGDKTKFSPYKQSKRGDIYLPLINELLAAGKAYYAFDSEDELKNLREKHEKKGEAFVYNWANRNSLKNSLSIDKKKVQKKIGNGDKYVVRFLSPESGEVTTQDLIRGVSTINCKTLDDKVLLKADGTPTYHLADVVDDHTMGITHVIRGEEWLPSLALHCLLYDAFGWELPVFAHLPLILNPNGKGKLSKRSGEKGGFPVFPINWDGNESFDGFREAGILAKALVNYLATLGWSPKEGSEIICGLELIEMFQIEKVVKAPANFDFERLKWFNHKYLQQTDNAKLAKILIELKPESSEIDEEKLIKAIGLVKDRADTINELWGLCKYLFFEPTNYNEKSLKKVNKEGLNKIVAEVLEKSLTDDIQGGLVGHMKEWGGAKNIAAGQIMMTLRMILVGELSGIGVQDIINFVGLKSVAKRTKNFKDSII